ncbi:kinetochore protein Spc25 isoform X2 [Tachyglossus aculeatus]|nr:kinetochore protein Spc25 isoform X2 [Tachyglossus aculeatus]XP_038607636.1 kinetochore protein Spc25 isoform X2 [Tachyglossus aculeatus]
MLTMSHIKTEEELALFDKSIDEFWTKFKNTWISEYSCQTVTLRDAHKEAIKTLTERWSVKLKEEGQMVEKILEYKREINKQNKIIKEKKDNLSELLSKIHDGQQEKEMWTQSIQNLKEELAKKKEIVSTTNEANKEKLKGLNKSSEYFKDRLGLEIRNTHGGKLQFIFRNIDPKDHEKPFMFSLCLNEEGNYEVTESAPHLDCLAELQEKVRETNNFSAFLANVRKAFIGLVYN